MELTKGEMRWVECILLTHALDPAEFKIDKKLRKHTLFDLLNNRLELRLQQLEFKVSAPAVFPTRASLCCAVRT
jgi:hypothetical protein